MLLNAWPLVLHMYTCSPQLATTINSLGMSNKTFYLRTKTCTHHQCFYSCLMPSRSMIADISLQLSVYRLCYYWMVSVTVAVLNLLLYDGHGIFPGWDPETGSQLTIPSEKGLNSWSPSPAASAGCANLADLLGFFPMMKLLCGHCRIVFLLLALRFQTKTAR